MRQHIATLPICPCYLLMTGKKLCSNSASTAALQGAGAKVATAIQRGDASGALAAITDKAGDNNSAGLGQIRHRDYNPAFTYGQSSRLAAVIYNSWPKKASCLFLVLAVPKKRLIA